MNYTGLSFRVAKDTYWSNQRDGVNLQDTPPCEVRHERLFPRFIAWIHADELSGRKRKAGSHSTIVLGLFFSGKNHGVEYVDMVEWMIWFLRDGGLFLRNIITASGNRATPRKKRKEKQKRKSMSMGILRTGNYLFLFLSISLFRRAISTSLLCAEYPVWSQIYISSVRSYIPRTRAIII